jgi:hypothetical protein
MKFRIISFLSAVFVVGIFIVFVYGLIKQSVHDDVAVALKSSADKAYADSVTAKKNLSVWTIRNYVDEFGDPTKDRYIRNTESIRGTFSNTATQNSELNVDMLMDDLETSNSSHIRISIHLYEYARDNPVKATSLESYYVVVKDNAGDSHTFTAFNHSADRLRLDYNSAQKLHEILMKGGKIQFHVQKTDRPTTRYNFAVANADGYDDAYRKLTAR